MLARLDHLVIAVAELEAATRDYAELLGRPPSWRGAHPGWGTANTLFRFENTYLELVSPSGAGSFGEALRERLGTHGEGPYALAFGTDDAAAATTALRAAGVPASEPTDGGGRDAASGAERQWRNVFLPAGATRGVPLFVIEHRSPPELLPLHPPSCDPAAAVAGVDHAVIMTGDAEASRALYGDGLGLRLALDRTFEGRGLRLLFFRVGGITVELAAPLAGGGGDDRFWGISYRVADVDAARARIAAAGFDVSEVRDGFKPGTRVCTVRDRTHGVATLCIGPA